jgi:hypothetical protein
MKLSSKVKTRWETFVKKQRRGTLSDEGSKFRERTETLKSMKEQYRDRSEHGYVLESGI